MAIAPTIRAAGMTDLGPVTGLLRDAHLPFTDIAPHLGNFLVAHAEGDLAGVAGLEAAAGFFEGLGFRREERAGVPPAIQGTREFSAFCPASAVVMHLALG